MSYKNEFTDEEWLILESAPLWILAIVGGIDGNIDKKEISVFTDKVISIASSSFSLTREVFQDVIANIATVINTPTNGETAIKGLLVVNSLLEKVDATEAKHFKESLIFLGNEISEASGSIFKKRSDQETKALALLAKMFDLI